MSECKFNIGNKVRFHGGKGKIIDIDRHDQADLLKVFTASGELRLLPDNVNLSRINNI